MNTVFITKAGRSCSAFLMRQRQRAKFAAKSGCAEPFSFVYNNEVLNRQL
jgi:hypothetical protein